MKILHKLKLLCVAALGFQAASAQVITWSPLFPTVNDSLTVTYDATQGNQALTGISPVYVHTGIVTGGPNATGWSLVQGTWGTAADSVRMTPLGDNKHQIKFHIKNYYGIGNQTVHRLAFVFRNASGSVTGKTQQNGDIFMPIYQAGQFGAALSAPVNGGASVLVSAGDLITVRGGASRKAGTTLRLLVNGTQVANVSDSTLSYVLPTTGAALKRVKLIGTNGATTIADSFVCVIRKPVPVAALPPNANLNGITYINNTTAILSLYAPFKDFIYVIGEFNNWQIDTAFYMNRTPDGNRYWLQINNLNAGQEYAYQYLINNQLKVADPYAEKILDPNNDQFISAATYPNLKPYPNGRTTGIVSILQTAQTPYVWTTTNFQRPAKTDIVAYELHVRDFVATRRYKTIIDSIKYFKRLGINCIEFMPLMEFEGNDSWGYNPSFVLAPDKAYGTKKDLQALIDTCHKHGIAVVLDMVLNHAFGQSPMVQMYWDAANNRPAANSPWFNPIPKHDFNVGYDFNHQTDATQKYVFDVLRYWLREYKMDGFRFDLSKGFTQNNTLGNTGAWGNADQSRINLWKTIHDTIQAISPGAYNILEHFADNSEETVLANYGMMLWGNINHSYNEATMGWLPNSDFSWISHRNRNWQQPHVFGYMESHDEERLMYRNTQFGNTSNANHNTRTLSVALNRMKLGAAFFFTVPGPKMIWQFGELGYDQSINRCPNGTISENCRTDAKPIRWNYYQDPERRALFDVYAALAKLKVNEDVFRTNNFSMSVGNNVSVKRIYLNGTDNRVMVIGNFNVTAQTVTGGFPQIGKFYDYFSGDSIEVSSTTQNITLQPAEYRIYSTKKMRKTSTVTSIENEIAESNGLVTFPNPFSEQIEIAYQLNKQENVQAIILNALGQQVKTLCHEVQSVGTQSLTWNGTNEANQRLASGTYFCQVRMGSRLITRKIVLM